MSDPGLVVSRALAVYQALKAAGIPCELGGALALAYHVDDPRGTRDIDVNVGVERADAKRVLSTLPADVPWDERSVAAIERDGQVRLRWPVTGAAPLPLDLFFAEHELHTRVSQRAVTVPMRDTEVLILSATDLTIFKALFDRPKDWVDIQAMLDAHDSSVDLADAAHWVARIVGERDPRVRRLRELQEQR